MKLQVARANKGEYRNATYNAVSLNNIHSLQELKNAFPDQFQGTPPLSFNLPLIHYTLNGQHSENVSITRFNEEIEFPRVIELINMGATDIYIDFGGAQPFNYATQYPNLGQHMPFYSIQLRVKVETYYYSAYDILDLLRERAVKTHNVGGSLISLDYPYNLPASGELYELLNNTIAPNFTFTQNTLFECVSEVFRLFDATFSLDGDNNLDIVYFNEWGERRNVQITGANSALGEERYINGLTSFYQDARVNEKFPHGENIYALSRADDIGIPDQGNHHFVTPHNIQSIVNAELLTTIEIGGVVEYYQGSPLSFVTYHLSNYPLNITSGIIEQNIWSGYLAVDGVFSTTENKQNNTVYFAQGDNKVQLAYSYKDEWGGTHYSFGNMILVALMRQLGMNGQFDSNCLNLITPSSSNPDWGEVYMRVEYLTTVNGKVRVESATNKFEGEMVIDQTSGAVDLNKLGLNILGLSYRMGEPALGISYKATSWENRIKPGQTILYDNSVWVANSCQYTSLGNGYHQGKISFVKNYNELALRKTLLREKRMSNIAQNLVLKSEDTLIEYCYFSSYSSPESQVSCFSRSVLGECLANSLGGNSSTIKTLDHAILYHNNKYVYLPTIRYGAGNMVCFEMTFDSPISAGISTNPNNETGWFGTEGFYSKYVPYADEDGYMDECSIGLIYNASGSFDYAFPQVTYNPNTACSIAQFKVYKQPNEVFALNYEIAFLADNENDFVGTAFINDNFLVNGYQRKKELRLYYSNEPYSVLDTKGKGNYVSCGLNSYNAGLDHTELVFSHSEVEGYWAICDNQGNILFASNNLNVAHDEKRLYFALRRERL